MTAARGRDELLAMFDRAGVPRELVMVRGRKVSVTVPDGWFEITPAAPAVTRRPRAGSGPQWSVKLREPGRLVWAVQHGSAGVVDQVRAGLFGMARKKTTDSEGVTSVSVNSGTRTGQRPQIRSVPLAPLTRPAVRPARPEPEPESAPAPERGQGGAIQDLLPSAWRGRVHVLYRTVHRVQKTRGCEDWNDAVQFCEEIDRIDVELETDVNRDWTLIKCTCSERFS